MNKKSLSSLSIVEKSFINNQPIDRAIKLECQHVANVFNTLPDLNIYSEPLDFTPDDSSNNKDILPTVI